MGDIMAVDLVDRHIFLTVHDKAYLDPQVMLLLRSRCALTEEKKTSILYVLQVTNPTAGALLTDLLPPGDPSLDHALLESGLPM